MKCPHCKQELTLPNRAWHNVENYIPRTALTITECCGKIIRLTGRVEFTAIASYEKEDDWGFEIE